MTPRLLPLSILLMAVMACGESEPTGGECATPLDEATLNKLIISVENHLSLQPEETFAFELSTFTCCDPPTPVTTCATWSVDPEGAGATVSDNGLFELDSTAASGDIFEVTALVENGREVSSKVYVYESEVDPLVGLWRETAQIDCATGASVAPEQAIEELRFHADGQVSVTWTPGELFDVDYKGSYRPDATSGEFSMDVALGDYIPPDVDARGTFAIESGELVLRDLWLGTPEDGTQPARCGHRFARR